MRKRALWLTAAILLAPAAAPAVPDPAGWLTYGGTGTRTGYVDEDAPARAALRHSWTRRLDGFITSQVLVADTAARGRMLYVGTSKGTLFALGTNGAFRWRVRFGRLRHSCNQLSEWGLIGTPVIDAAAQAIYVVDAFGRLHARDLATGRELAGWPVQVYADFRREVVWGALALIGRAVYVPTASYCDRPMEGKVIRVDVATRAVTTWVSVPRSLGGGGGIWGWGGIAYSPQRDSLLVVTGNAFEGGRNRGRVYRATAGYGEQLVELSPDLQVRSSSRPTNLHPTGDFDFVGSPVPFVDSRCGELAATLNKNGRLYVWRTAAIPNGTISSLRIANTTLAKPLFTQLAYSERAHALYAVTYRRLLRIDIGAGCRARVTWSRRLGLDLANSSATVAGNLVWFVRTGARSALLGVDAGTGAVRFRGLVGAPGLVAPTVLGNRIYFGSLAGELHGFALVPR